ncbi:hypothetical protein [Amycolatopsis sp. H20-H5]|uniref:hypothetical protein n=1 Tax=Amycolatopsis sp. H20-H5 TaxID=3046309 RepID=UPI002DBFF97F|nr:hypothetical protein [Amycolatopsis sp. H20-H5]MEC3974169.1 hypothetical protein [Amycolatopsis sp. H20-H5]
MSRRRTAAVVVVALLAGGCSSAPPAKPTYELPPRPVRENETPLKLPPATNGSTVFTLIGLTTGFSNITGSHAEWQAKGQYARFRVVVTSTGLSSVPFDTKRQLLVEDNGATVGPDEQAMLIKRQPGTFDLGPNVRVEFDLYFDIPKDRKAVALRAVGGPTLTDMKNLQGTEISLG